MTTDKRLNWEYKGCKIVPIACHRDSDWGKEIEPINFGFRTLSRYWRIDFPDETWVHVDTKPECRNYIDTMFDDLPDLLLAKAVRARLNQFAMRIESSLDSSGKKQLRLAIGRKNKSFLTKPES